VTAGTLDIDWGLQNLSPRRLRENHLATLVSISNSRVKILARQGLSRRRARALFQRVRENIVALKTFVVRALLRHPAR
jgi:hypothetical protein